MSIHTNIASLATKPEVAVHRTYKASSSSNNNSVSTPPNSYSPLGATWKSPRVPPSKRPTTVRKTTQTTGNPEPYHPHLGNETISSDSNHGSQSSTVHPPIMKSRANSPLSGDDTKELASILWSFSDLECTSSLENSNHGSENSTSSSTNPLTTVR